MSTATTDPGDREREAIRSALADRYDVQAEIGHGATAVVYRAQDLRHDRPVALKVLRPDIAAGFGSERFLREIGLVARLQHPHIVPIYDSGSVGEILYYVMPFIEGESLREKLEREPNLPLDLTLRLVLEVAEQAEMENLTVEGLGLGTPVYMSPEQALGEQGVDGRADLYSLGCVMYEMLDGRAPFSGRSIVEMLARKATQDAPELQHRVEEIPAHVRAALRCSLDREPGGRFPTLTEFADALTRPTVDGEGVRPRRRGSPPTRSLAVLPFADRSAAADNEFLSDGITEDLISALSRLDGLRVVARSSAFAFKGSTRDVRDVAAELGVTSVLGGSIRRQGSRLRITADLVDAETGFALWTERYDRELTDVFEVQDDITRSIVATLTTQLLGTQKRLVEAPTASMAAYQAYQKGRFDWNQRTESALLRSLEHLAHAVREDPDFALAHAGLADARLVLAIYGVRAPIDVIPRARADAERALALRADSAEALAARASVRALYDENWEGAERDYLAALAAHEQYATAHQWFAMHLLGPRGRFAEARVRLARARELDPLSAAIGASAGLLRYYERDHEQALVEFTLVLERHPQFSLAHLGRGLTLSALGRHSDAIEALRAATLFSASSPEAVSALAFAQARGGEVAAAREGLAALEALAATRYVSATLLAQVHAGLDEVAPALDRLEQARAARATDLSFLGHRPTFDSLRAESRFRLLVT